MGELRILVADDHEVVRKGVISMLEGQNGWKVVAEASNGREAVEKTVEFQPDVVILDISMPELNGFDAARQARRAAPNAEVLILTMHDSEQMAREVLSAGARGYILKTDAARDLISAVQALSDHRPFFTSRVSDMVLEGYLHGPSHDGTTRALTAREREVVQLLAEGKSHKEIAALLAISIRTVETHRANVMHKLGLHSLGELIHYAIRNKMIAVS